MVIEVKEKGSREFYEEVVNVVAQYGRLRKKPEARAPKKKRGRWF